MPYLWGETLEGDGGGVQDSGRCCRTTMPSDAYLHAVRVALALAMFAAVIAYAALVAGSRDDDRNNRNEDDQ